MASSLYIHIPFCLKKCGYCDFVSVPYDEVLSKKYTDMLIKELAMRAGESSNLKTIYIGGGTPTTLNERDLKDIFKALRLGFDLSAVIEASVETNPGTIDERKIDLLLSLGVNRVSMGVQSFSDKELSTLGRLHTASDAFRAASMIKKAGIENLSLDLIYGIPGQTPGSWKETVSRALELNPRHISAYELTPERCTSLYDALSKGTLSLPDEDEASDMLDFAIEEFRSSGLTRYEISNYALPGYECLHNVNYWRRGEYVGAGASAHSCINNNRIKNTGDINKYITLLSENILPIEETAEATKDDELKETIFLGLRMTEGLDMCRIEEKTALLDAARPLLEGGLMDIEGDYIRLTERGMAVYNAAVVEILRRLAINHVESR